MALTSAHISRAEKEQLPVTIEVNGTGRIHKQLYIVGVEDGRILFARIPNGKARWWLTYEYVKAHSRLDWMLPLAGEAQKGETP